MGDCISQPIRGSQVTKKKKKEQSSHSHQYNFIMKTPIEVCIKDVIEGRCILSKKPQGQRPTERMLKPWEQIKVEAFLLFFAFC